jgi:lactate permease
MAILIALTPILLVLLFMVGLRQSAARSAVVALVATLVLSVGYFGADSALVLGASAEAGFTTLTILWIIFAALCLHELGTATGAFAILRQTLLQLSTDRRILAILVAWFFALFIEGAAGFGTSAALAAPMLVGIGFTPLQAVTLALIGHAPGVSFGAVGTPVLPQIAASPFTAIELAWAVAFLHGSLGWIVMIFLMRIVHNGGELTLSTAPSPMTRKAGAITLWAALAAFMFLGTYMLIARTIGPELPTMAGALIGGVGFVLLLRFFYQDQLAVPIGRGDTSTPSSRGILWATLPYLVLILLILLTRLSPPLQDLTRSVNWAWELPGGFKGSVQPLYHSGTLLLLGFVVGGLAQGAKPSMLTTAMRHAAARLPMVALALFAMLCLARLMVHAGMIDILAQAAASHLGGIWPMLVPWVGILGAFITGSATASNILFSDFQQATATALALPPLLLLGTQNFGAAIGNMICPHNIIAACAVVGLSGQEGAVMRRTLPACIACAVAGGLLTWAIIGLG